MDIESDTLWSFGMRVTKLYWGIMTHKTVYQWAIIMVTVDRVMECEFGLKLERA